MSSEFQHLGSGIYVKPIGGCEKADLYLGTQSKCTECPFIRCMETDEYADKHLSRRNRGLDKWREVLREKGMVSQ